MTPAERQLVTELFDRLATLEDAQRDPDAERAIRDGLAQAPNAVYALVQAALVQDEALKDAGARIQELEAELGIGNPPPRQGGFLDNMRDSIWGRPPQQRGSVPSVRPGDAPMGAPAGFGNGGAPMGGPGYGPAGQMPPEPQQQGRGGSFLGTAAAAAAGVIGGSMLLDGIRSMTGGRSGGGVGLSDPAAAAGRGNSPWGNSGGGGGDDLARQAGINDIGRSGGSDPVAQSQGQGLFNAAEGGKGADANHSDVSAIDDSDFELDDSDDVEGDFFDSDE
jgi:hypothetical protein